MAAGGLFFFHTPKAGGTAVARALAALFAVQERCPLIENSQRDHERRAGDYNTYRGYRYYGGHYGFDIFSQIAGDHLPVTNFRDPVLRLYSLYRYFRLRVSVPDNPAARDDLYPVVFAQSYDFRSFVATDDPRIEVHTRNHHVRQLSGSAWCPGDPADLPHALRLLDRMPWFYVCAHPGLSKRRAHSVFGDSFGPIGEENITGGGYSPGPGPADRQIILEKNQLDVALYRAAEQRLLSWANR